MPHRVGGAGLTRYFIKAMMGIIINHPCRDELLGVGSCSIKVSIRHGQRVWMLVRVPIAAQLPLVRLLISVAVCVKIHSPHISRGNHQHLSSKNSIILFPISKVHALCTMSHGLCHGMACVTMIRSLVTVVTNLSAFSLFTLDLYPVVNGIAPASGLWRTTDH